jgi:hypothetical protein
MQPPASQEVIWGLGSVVACDDVGNESGFYVVHDEVGPHRLPAMLIQQLIQPPQMHQLHELHNACAPPPPVCPFARESEGSLAVSVPASPLAVIFVRWRRLHKLHGVGTVRRLCELRCACAPVGSWAWLWCGRKAG